MNKTIILIGMSLGSLIGGGLPYVFGDHDFMSGWVFFGSFVGGIIGIWLGVKVSRALR